MTKPGLGQAFVRAKISAVGSVGCARDFSHGASIGFLVGMFSALGETAANCLFRRLDLLSVECFCIHSIPTT